MGHQDRLTVIQAYRFALDPTPGQVRELLRHVGAARVAYNWGLARVKANLSQRAAERSYGIAEVDLTPSVGWSLYAMRKDWNQVKGQVAPWWAACSKEAYNTGLDQLACALGNWSDSRGGGRKGRRIGFPRFKSRRKHALSVRFTTGIIRVEDDRHHVRLPRLGTIKTHESTRKLHRRIADGRARILSATVRAEAGRWFVSFTVEVQRAKRTPARPDAVVGVDLGVKTPAVFSDGRSAVPNPRHYDAARRKLARLFRAVSRRQGPDRHTGQQASNRWRRANTARNRVHHRIVNLRGDAIHKLTTALAREYAIIVVEGLNVAGMVKNRRLARVICDAGFGQIRRQLTYKTTWNGGTLVVADRWYPSSKRCSGCGAVKTKLRLSERVFACTTCGLALDRDANAALNFASLVEHVVVAGSGPEIQNGRGADPKTRPVRAGGCETSTPHRAVPARVRRGPSPSNGRTAEIH
ncbi:MAG TPA: IS607 family element RNA-guided endonuclease TnpB [Actinoallomurus sp.]|nr:IS607 family element RNA-guided endonuclease TnpB [Actinoallomurus sp.]